MQFNYHMSRMYSTYRVVYPKKILKSVFLLGLLIGGTACSESSGRSSAIVRGENTVELAVIGDVPYHDVEIAEFPGLIEAIDSDPFVSTVVHVGDIKSGETECSDQRYGDIYWSFLSFKEPLIYTMGDNEWTDCDRVSAGAYDPVERLDRLREIFFEVPGNTLGGREMQVEAQTSYPENQLWQEKEIVFGTLHIVGSNNHLKSGAGLPGPQEQTETGSSEYGRRTAANISWLRGIFQRATESQSAGVVLFFHADMWKQREQFVEAEFGGYTEIVQELSILVESYSRPVIFVSGENHHFRVDAGVPWFSLYDVSPVSNATQIIVDQGIRFPTNAAGAKRTWLRLVADASTEKVFSWELVSSF